MKTIKLRVAIGTFLLTTCLFLTAHAAAQEAKPEQALLVVTGDPLPQVRIGQANHCSELKEIDQSTITQKDRLNIMLGAGQETWVSLTGRVGSKTCESMVSFVPNAGSGYIARLGKFGCIAQLYLAKKGEAPALVEEANDAHLHDLLCATTVDPSSGPKLATPDTRGKMLVGQEGYCGKMEEAKPGDKAGVPLKAGVRNWVRLFSSTAVSDWQGNFSFVPQTGANYIFIENKMIRIQADGKSFQEPLSWMKVTNETDLNDSLCADATAAEPRLVTGGAEPDILVGQDGYCGKMENFTVGGKSAALLKADVRNWVRLITKGFRTQYEGDFSFVPKQGVRYLVNGSRLYRLQPDGTYAVEPLTPEPNRSCLFQ